MRDPRRRRPLVCVAAVVLFAAGCDGAPAEEAPQVDDTAEAADGGEGGDPPAGTTGPTGALRLTGWVQEHPRMVAVSLRGLEVDETGNLWLDIEAVNRGFRGTSSASLGEFGVRLRDDRGNVYEFQPATDNEDLAFVADERLSGTLDGSPLVIAEIAPLEGADLDEWVAGQMAQSEVPVEAEQVDVTGATQARLIRQDFGDGYRTLVVAVDEDEGFAVLVDVGWADGDLTNDEVAEIVGSVQLGQETQA